MTAWTNHPFRTEDHSVDLCVVGGGMAGLATAVAAARHGARVALLHDRPVLGGNASSECRVHICGADRHNRKPGLRETGLLEELRLENLRRNPQRSFSVWDTVLYEAARFQPGLTLLLNTSVLDAELHREPADDRPGRIASVTGWQGLTQTAHRVEARFFADCSGDGILAPLSGAACRIGREARSEYNESLAPDTADRCTMGQSILFQTRQYPTAQPFEPPAWAYTFRDCDELPYGKGQHAMHWELGYWWMELGGDADSIHDADRLRDEGLRIAWGVWDHIKNHCPATRARARNWAIEWMQFLPAKRESRRYLGRHTLSQNDIEAGGNFDDLVAYGGWTMDDHRPEGFWGKPDGRKPTNFNPVPVPYGIPLRCMLSANVENLCFAGRCHAATHMAMSSTRVMGTATAMGQALGTAVGLAVRRELALDDLPRHIDELQQTLLRDDVYLPGVPQRFGPITTTATLTAGNAADPEPLRDGIHRPVDDAPHAWGGAPGEWIALRFDARAHVDAVTVILDSAMHKNLAMSHHVLPTDDAPPDLPDELPRHLTFEVLSGGQWQRLTQVTDNARRQVRVPVGEAVEGVRFRIDACWSARADQPSAVYAFYVD